MTLSRSGNDDVIMASPETWSSGVTVHNCRRLIFSIAYVIKSTKSCWFKRWLAWLRLNIKFYH